jgi:hypothetical protein
MVPRPRPFGVDLRTSWDGWAMPSLPVATLTATLVGMLYTLVPVGRWRQRGKWVATALVTLFALARVYLGVDAPTDALVGAVIGVAVSVAAYRLFVPSESFPIVYRRGRSAHLDVSGRRGQAIRQALADQLGLLVLDVQPFGLSGSAGSTPLRITVKGHQQDTYLEHSPTTRRILRALREHGPQSLAQLRQRFTAPGAKLRPATIEAALCELGAARDRGRGRQRGRHRSVGCGDGGASAALQRPRPARPP